MAQQDWVARLRRIVDVTRPRPQRADGVFVAVESAAATRQQQERIWALVRRGRRTLLISAALMFGALLIATARGYASWSSLTLVVAVLVLAGVFALVDRRLAEHPPGSAEVPADLADLILEIYQIRDEIIIYGPDRLAPDPYERVVGIIGGHVTEIVTAATKVLTAERAGDRDTALALRADIERRFESIMDIHEELEDRLDGADPVAADPADADSAIDGADWSRSRSRGRRSQ